jgi:hypothetical protein
MRAGELLSKAKADVPHGEWARWLNDNFKLTERTAQRWIRLHKNRQHIAELKSDTGSDLTLRQLERLIAVPAQGSKKSATGSKSAAEPKVIGGNDVVSAVAASEDKHFTALVSLNRNDPAAAKIAASKFLKRLKEAGLL